MADWYVSSAAHAAVPVFAVSTAYTVGQFVRRITSTARAQWVMRCTTAGTSAGSEPTWPTANNGTVTTGSAVFTNVTGQSAYGWSAPAGDILTLFGAVGTARFQGNDRVFVSSDHAETQTGSNANYGASTGGTANYNVGQILSVDRAGSVPPVAADLLAGASVTLSSNSMLFETFFPTYHYGIIYTYTGTGTTPFIFGSGGTGVKTVYLDNCQLYLNSATASLRITNAQPVTLVLNNSTVRFGATSHGFGTTTGLFEVVWLDTPSAIAGATFPTALFVAGNYPWLLTARGVDLSAITGTLINNGGGGGSKYLLDSCRIASGVTRLSTGSMNNTRDLVELINCYDGTNILNESYQPAGTVTTERTITLSGGATDDVGTFSHKLVSGTNVDKYANPLAGFWLDCEYQTTGAPKTATVEIISSGSLNNDEISLLLEYQGTAGSPVASISSSLPATVLTTAAAVTSSSETWNSSPATPVKQKLEVTFTPEVAGRVRGQVRLGKASTTVYVDPVLRIA